MNFWILLSLSYLFYYTLMIALDLIKSKGSRSSSNKSAFTEFVIPTSRPISVVENALLESLAQWPPVKTASPDSKEPGAAEKNNRTGQPLGFPFSKSGPIPGEPSKDNRLHAETGSAQPVNMIDALDLEIISDKVEINEDQLEHYVVEYN
jgi:hypothetical protein